MTVLQAWEIYKMFANTLYVSTGQLNNIRSS